MRRRLPSLLEVAQNKLRDAEARRVTTNNANDRRGFVDACYDYREAFNEIERLKGKPPAFTDLDREGCYAELLRREQRQEIFAVAVQTVRAASEADKPARIAELLEAYPHIRHAEINWDSELMPQLSGYPTGPMLLKTPEAAGPEQQAFYAAHNDYETAKWYGSPEDAAAARVVLDAAREAMHHAANLRMKK